LVPEVAEVITGGTGRPDRAGEQWAAKPGIPAATIKPNWKLGKGAGLNANRQLAVTRVALVALHDVESTGTRDTIEHIKATGLPVHKVVVAD
jgi:NAD(P)H-nitrite reductase large subunit